MVSGFGYDEGAPVTPYTAGPEAAYTRFFELLAAFTGETVTIFTTSGGESGSGITGVILAVNPCFVRIVTHIGPAPACALGNCCSPVVTGGYGGMMGGYGGGVVRTVGSVADIPLDRIVAFVHNAVR
ncbi:MAG: hypothetical protein ACM3TR_18600 [Caulobacteraceae bacterium]